MNFHRQWQAVSPDAESPVYGTNTSQMSIPRAIANLTTTNNEFPGTPPTQPCVSRQRFTLIAAKQPQSSHEPDSLSFPVYGRREYRRLKYCRTRSHAPVATTALNAIRRPLLSARVAPEVMVRNAIQKTGAGRPANQIE